MSSKVSAQNDAEAEQLFRDGKRLMADKRLGEACPKFAESARLAPSSGVELALGLCYEAAGKTASAWGAFTAVVPLARRDARKDRERVATAHATALEPKLARVTFKVDPGSAALPGFELRTDGMPLRSAAWGDAPVDPGDHHVEALAPGYVTYLNTFSIADGSTATVPVPVLTAAPSARPPPPPETVRWKTVGLVTGGAGIASLVVGTIVGAVALGKVSDAQKTCPRSPCDSPGAIDENNTGGTIADASTGLFITGGVLVGAGVLMFLLGPSGKERAAKTSSGQPIVAPGYLGWEGTF